MNVTRFSFAFVVFVAPSFVLADDVKQPDYNRDIAPIFKKYCTGCHNPEDAEGGLVLDRFDRLLKGGENGAVIVSKKSDRSRLLLVLEKKAKPFMPPEGSEGPSAKEIAVLKAWIDAGSKGPNGNEPDPNLLVVPKVKTVGAVRRPIQSVAWSPSGKWIAVGRYGAIEILSATKQKLIKKLSGLKGPVNRVVFSRDGQILVAVAGEPGLFGEVQVWNVSNWKLLRSFRAHTDCIYAAALSSDGRVLATGSYDRSIKLWDVATGKELKILTGHNDAVYDVDFHPNNKILASASGDRTVKLWSVETGKRLDTFSQPLKEQYAVAFSPNGKQVVAGGVDNRIRVWQLGKNATAGTNRMVFAQFAHQGPVLDLEFSSDGRLLASSSEDRTIKLWETQNMTQLRKLEQQSDWVSSLAISPKNSVLLAGRLNGTLTSYPINTAVRSPRETTSTATQPKVVAPIQQGKKPVEVAEVEPNDVIAEATTIAVPSITAGVLKANNNRSQDVDLFRFEAKKGQVWIIETAAERRKTAADTRIEILHSDGRPVLRLLLRAVRDSYIEFRPIDSRQTQLRMKNWEETGLNQFVYMAGEVCKFFRMPEGPDSGTLMYTINGKRKCYFDTSGRIHALDDPVYIVEPFPPATKLIDNGLPVFKIYYSNDDDGDRKLGADSRLSFTAPDDGQYLVRVTDIRGFHGDKNQYWLTIRAPKPDFNVSISGKGAKVGRGSGQRLTFKLDRLDGFDDQVLIEISGLPAGVSVSNTAIQAGHLEARAVINVSSEIKPPTKDEWKKVKVTAIAMIHGKKVSKNIGNLGEIKVIDVPKAVAFLLPEQGTKSTNAAGSNRGSDLVIAPGTTIKALIRIERHNGFKGELRFDVDNLPHGVIVDNLGLSGVMIREGETERQIFISAADWVPETTRMIHAVSRTQGNQASLPLRFEVRHADQVVRAVK